MADDNTPAPAQPAEEKSLGRFSLHSLSAAFARLTSSGNPEPSAKLADALQQVQAGESAPLGAEIVSPRMIVEAMLFVGNVEGRPLTNREIAATIRDVSPKEVDSQIEQLNELYRETGTAYEIASVDAGYKMRLRDQCQAIGQRFRSRVRESKLTVQAIEVLSVVAYRQPITSEEVAQLRGTRSHRLLNNLVRRGLLQLERSSSPPARATYHTTDRFNRLFRVKSPADLPNSEELEDR